MLLMILMAASFAPESSMVFDKNYRPVRFNWSAPMSRTEDFTCQKPYETRETIVRLDYDYGFVIKSIETWNVKEGKQVYEINEADILSRADQGYLAKMIPVGRTVTVGKQACGMGGVGVMLYMRK